MKTVIVTEVPGRSIEVVFEDSMTAAEAMVHADRNFNPTVQTLSINGAPTGDVDSPLEDGDRVIISKGSKNNS